MTYMTQTASELAPACLRKGSMYMYIKVHENNVHKGHVHIAHVHVHVHLTPLFRRVTHEQLQHSLTQEQENSQKLQHQLEDVIGRMEAQAAEMQMASTTADMQVRYKYMYMYVQFETCTKICSST